MRVVDDGLGRRTCGEGGQKRENQEDNNMPPDVALGDVNGLATPG